MELNVTGFGCAGTVRKRPEGQLYTEAALVPPLTTRTGTPNNSIESFGTIGSKATYFRSWIVAEKILSRGLVSASSIIRKTCSMASEYKNLSCMSVDLDDGHIAWISLNHPPTNLLDGDMAGELDKTLLEMEFDRRIRVIVLQSALPQFFISHSGLARVGAGPKQISATTNFRQSQVLTERLRNHPKCIIAKVEGIARGGGDEVVLGADMAFASHGAIFGQPEIGMGLVPGGGSTQRLPALVGRARAMEILLGGDDFSAETAAQWGWINRAMSAEELGPFVEKLARRIASWPPYTVAALKAAVNQGVQSWVPAGLLHEAHNADISVSHDITRARVKEGLELGLETADGEVRLLEVMARLSPVLD